MSFKEIINNSINAGNDFYNFSMKENYPHSPLVFCWADLDGSGLDTYDSSRKTFIFHKGWSKVEVKEYPAIAKKYPRLVKGEHFKHKGLTLCEIPRKIYEQLNYRNEQAVLDELKFLQARIEGLNEPNEPEERIFFLERGSELHDYSENRKTKGYGFGKGPVFLRLDKSKNWFICPQIGTAGRYRRENEYCQYGVHNGTSGKPPSNCGDAYIDSYYYKGQYRFSDRRNILISMSWSDIIKGDHNRSVEMQNIINASKSGPISY